MERIRVGIITAPRTVKVDLLDRVIHTMRVEDAVIDSPETVRFGVFMDGTDAPVLEEPIDHLEVRTEKELAELRKWPYYGASNLARALRWAAQDSEVAVVSEDDLLVRSGCNWFQLARQMLGHLAEKFPDVLMPVLCLSQGFFFSKALGPITTSFAGVDLHLWDVKITSPNGMSPMVMLSPVAAKLADSVDRLFSQVEPDVAIFRACAIEHVAAGFYTNPCLAMHADISSTYAPDRDWIRAATKMFHG